MKCAFPLALLLLSPALVLSAPQKSFQELASRADAARTADRTSEAIQLYSEGIHLRPTWSEGWWWLGSLLYDADRFPEAVPAFKKFIALMPKSGPGYAFLALCEYETHNFDDSLRHFGEWARRGSPGDDALLDVAGFHWALLLTRDGQFVQALYLLAAKAAKLGSSPALVEAMGLASLRISNLPEEYPPQKREMVWLAGEAAFYAAVHDYPRADEYADRLLVHYGSEPNVHYFRGTLSSFRKDWPADRRECERELQISPQHVPAMIELALANINDFQPADAVPWGERAAQLDPRNARAHYALGWALLETDRLSESIRELELAKELAPASAPIRFTMANAYRKAGRSADAKRESAAFLSLKDKQESLSVPQEKTTHSQQAGSRQ